MEEARLRGGWRPLGSAAVTSTAAVGASVPLVTFVSGWLAGPDGSLLLVTRPVTAPVREGVVTVPYIP